MTKDNFEMRIFLEGLSERHKLKTNEEILNTSLLPEFHRKAGVKGLKLGSIETGHGENINGKYLFVKADIIV